MVLWWGKKRIGRDEKMIEKETMIQKKGVGGRIE